MKQFPNSDTDIQLVKLGFFPTPDLQHLISLQGNIWAGVHI
jgi:hypothetical protein